MIVVLIGMLTYFTTKDWDQYWSFYLETDEYPTIVTLANANLLHIHKMKFKIFHRQKNFFQFSIPSEQEKSKFFTIISRSRQV